MTDPEKAKEKLRAYTFTIIKDIVKKFNVGTPEQLLETYLMFANDYGMGALEFDDEDDTGVSTTVENVVITNVQYVEEIDEYIVHITDLSPVRPGELRGPTEMTVRIFVEDDVIEIEEVEDYNENHNDTSDPLH